MMDKKLFDDAIGEVPASTVDVEAAIARGRRAARIRKVANPVTAVVGGVLVLTVGIGALLVPGDPTDTVGGTPPPSPSTVPCEGTMVPPPDADTVRADRIATTLTTALERALPANARLVKVSSGSSASPVTVLVEQQASTQACENEPASIEAYTGVTWMGSSNTRVLVEIRPLPPSDSIATWCDEGGVQATCTEETTPGGDHVVGIAVTRGGVVAAHGAEVTKADGTAVSVLVDGSMIADGDAYSPPLSVQQVIEIARDPGLTLGP
jgi:hypothetical protein